MDKDYYDPSKAGSFSGAQSFAFHNSKQPIDKVREWLSAQKAYTLHKQIKRKFPRRKTLAFFIDNLWQLDLMDVSAISKENNNFHFILCCIDALSRFAWLNR